MRHIPDAAQFDILFCPRRHRAVFWYFNLRIIEKKPGYHPWAYGTRFADWNTVVQ